MTVRVYGPAVNNDSWGRVAAGLVSGLQACGWLADFHSTQMAENELDDGLTEGAEAEIGVFVGPPSLCGMVKSRGFHRERLLMLAANSSWLPRDLPVLLTKVLTGIVTPSDWSAEVIRRHCPELPVEVWRHGVSPAFRPQEHLQRRADAAYNVLHLTSTAGGRKGTRELVRAWLMLQRCQELGNSRLHIVSSAPPGRFTAELLLEAQPDARQSVVEHPRLNLSEEQANALYQSVDLVCQPSRGEGFGMVPLEARAAGVPVCVTACTGHAEHVQRAQPGVVVVPSGEDTPVDDGPGACAPSLSARSLAESLKFAYERRDQLKADACAAADTVRESWSWRAVTDQWLQSEPRASRPRG